MIPPIGTRMNTKSFLGYFALSLMLGACVSAKAITGPDGSVNHLISCPSIETCYNKARQVCRGNYDIVNTSSEVSGLNGSTNSTTKLLVKCQSK